MQRMTIDEAQSILDQQVSSMQTLSEELSKLQQQVPSARSSIPGARRELDELKNERNSLLQQERQMEISRQSAGRGEAEQRAKKEALVGETKQQIREAREKGEAYI